MAKEQTLLDRITAALRMEDFEKKYESLKGIERDITREQERLAGRRSFYEGEAPGAIVMLAGIGLGVAAGLMMTTPLFVFTPMLTGGLGLLAGVLAVNPVENTIAKRISGRLQKEADMLDQPLQQVQVKITDILEKTDLADLRKSSHFKEMSKSATLYTRLKEVFGSEAPPPATTEFKATTAPKPPAA